MRRDQLEHAIRTACQIIGADAVIVVGSQALLGSVDEGLLPPEATMSLEVDILPIAPDEPSTVELADRIEGVAGEWSPFEELHGFSIDGVSLSTAALPTGWRDRLVKVQNATQQRSVARRGSPDGAWSGTTCASRSWSHCARRTRTSSRPCWLPAWWTRR